MQITQGVLSLLLLGRAAAADGNAPSRLRVPGHKVVPSALRSKDAQVAMEEEAVFGALRDKWGKEDEDEPDWDMSMPNTPDMPIDEPECEWYERECDDGMCVGAMKMCPGDCNWKMKMCDDGTCVLHWFESCAEKDFDQEDDEWGKEDEDEPHWDMSMPNIMPVDEPDMPVDKPECELYERECEEGICVSLKKMCPGDCHFGMKKCDDGTCVFHWFESCAEKDSDLATE